jgi:regulator of cell morphogenesis and NO signaling
MITIDPTTTLADVVTHHPSLARELERRRLDYCCGGDRSLAEACMTAGLDPQAVATELSDIARPGEAPPAWSSMGVAQLVDHLESTHHRYLWDELPRLTDLLATIGRVHGARHPELADVARCFAELCDDMEPHLRKEEMMLFPAIRRMATAEQLPELPFGSITNPISVMLREHDRVGELLEELRALTHDYEVPADGCASYRACFDGLAELEADTHLHVHKENNLLFPAVVAIERRLGAAS